MRVALVLVCSGALILGACGSAKTVVSTDPTSSTTAAGPSSTAAGSPTTTTTPADPTTTAANCPTIPPPMTPVTGPATTTASLLTNVSESGDACVDRVAFDFTSTGAGPPGYSVTYGTPPFSDSGSGAPVAVAGTAFIVITIRPGYGYDFVSGKPTYTGPKNLPIAHANHVRGVAETGDYEGVLNWVIGLDSKRPFQVAATGSPGHQLVVSIG